MKSPPYAGAAISEQQIADGVGYDENAYTPFAAPPQISRPSRIRSLNESRVRKAHYRYDLNTWCAGPPGSPMPQAHEYGLALAPSSSAAILWPGSGS